MRTTGSGAVVASISALKSSGFGEHVADHLCGAADRTPVGASQLVDERSGVQSG